MTAMWPDPPEPSAAQVAERVSTERHGHVLLIRMERTDKHNALDVAMTRALDAALNTLEDDDELRCGVLAGGPRSFCAGTDIATGPGAPTERGGNYGVVARHRTTPLVAAVEGAAYGGGFELVLACDLVVAGRSARFALPEVGLGLVANCGALFRAPRAMPPAIAREMLLTGDPLDADRALALGLLNEVVDDGDAQAAALALAGRVARRSPVAVRATLGALDAAVAEADAHGWVVTDDAVTRVAAAEDRREGVAAFFEKREPAWPGR